MSCTSGTDLSTGTVYKTAGKRLKGLNTAFSNITGMGKQKLEFQATKEEGSYLFLQAFS